MRTLKRNKQPFYYCLLNEDAENRIHDEYGNETGELINRYERPVLMYANISPATGQTRTEQFGDLADYDKVIVTGDLDCPITESTVLFVDKLPEFTQATTYERHDSEPEQNETVLGESAASNTVLGESTWDEQSYGMPKYDYIVRRVSRSLNSVSIAIRKVTVQ